MDGIEQKAPAVSPAEQTVEEAARKAVQQQVKAPPALSAGLRRLRKRRPAPAEEEGLGPMMKAIRAVHSATNAESTAPEDLERQRAGQELLGRLISPALGMRYESFSVGNIPAEWVSLEAGHDRRHVILYCHGGGYTCGQLGYARILASKLAYASGCDVLAFEYRLAPENPYPAAVEDAVAVWDHLMYLGYGARNVLLAGDSAGGNLALELALTLKAQGRRQPRAMMLMSPWTDMTCSGPSHRECVELDPTITPLYISAVRAAYLGNQVGPDRFADPRWSPLFADLRGLPPTLIQVGTNEILRSDSELLHEKMLAQGVHATLEVYSECWHVFQQVPTRRAAQAMESMGRFIQKQLA
ncbi:MAG: alpha/beta hydrolase [Gemmiger sp.]